MLKIQSLQRRRERYAIIHTWKILNNLTNNDSGLSFTDTENSSRTGKTATVPPVPRNVPARVVSLYEHSFAVKDPLSLENMEIQNSNLSGILHRIEDNQRVLTESVPNSVTAMLQGTLTSTW